MTLPINKGPDFTPSQWIAATIGLFVSLAAAQLLAVTKIWSVAMMIAGFSVPPAIVGWLKARGRRMP